MTSKLRSHHGVLALAVIVLLVAAMALGPPVSAEDAKGPQTFDTPEAAAEAAVEAAKANDDAALEKLIGSDEADLIQSGKDPAVKKTRADFAARAAEYMSVADNEDGSKTVVVGHNKWPLPIPIVKSDAGWHFDGAAGRDEVLMRRIGDNELNAIELCRAYAQAQIDYASKDRDGDGVREYAQRVRSRPGKKDGLYWEAEEGDETSPFGPLIEPAKEYLRGHKPGDPVGGYVWRILTGQGPAAPGGRHSYIINGNMIAGFAAVGFPADYGDTGIMTFLVSHHGKVFQKDLGPDTAAIVRATPGYNADKTWTEVKEEE